MRKADPAGVLADFVESSEEIIEHFDRIESAIAVLPTRESDLSRLATQSFLALFVEFERFCSDLLLAYLNRDFSVYQGEISSRLAKSVTDKFNSVVASHVTLNIRQHVSMTDLEAFIDPTAWNLTFSTVAKLRDYATRHLAAGHAARINSISAPEARLVDTARAIRDFVAHQSEGSKKRMNEALVTVESGSQNRNLGRTVNAVNNAGPYLKASAGGVRRLHLYRQALYAIATKM